MATSKELLTAAYNGETPEITPYSIYDWYFSDPRYPRSEFQPLIDMGLGVTYGCGTVEAVQHGVSFSDRHETRGSQRYNYLTMHTPVGDLHSLTITPLNANQGVIDWIEKPWVTEDKEYTILKWVAEHTELKPAYSGYEEYVDSVGDDGIVLLGGMRTPAQHINLDYCGTEKFCMDIAMQVPELLDLYEAEKKLFMEHMQLIADGPGRWVKWLENLTIEMLGPRRYRQYLLNIYKEAVPILEAGGKRVLVHYDGNLRVIKEDIANAPFHMVESLTEPPEGNLMYDECRAAWPDKAYAGNINVGLYELPDEQLAQAVIEKRERAGKKGFSFEISEEVPHNWREKIPVVLAALQKLG